MIEGEPYRVVDLFSGAGGLSLGFDDPRSLYDLPSNLGYDERGFPHEGAFETVFCAELDDDARETFQQHFEIDDDNTLADITEREGPSNWNIDADVVIGGPPCQGFSLLNSTKTEDLDDDRNGLWRYYMDAVEGIDPDVFLIENVPRFLDTNEGLGAVRRAAENLGYDVVIDRLWAHHYGVPQKRQRAFVLGLKSESGGLPFFPKPTHTDESALTVRDAIADLTGYYDEGKNEFDGPEGVDWHKKRRRHQVTYERILTVDKDGGTFEREEVDPDLVPACWKNTDGFRDGMGRLAWDDPSVTIRKGFNDPMKGRYVHPEENRVITVREGARLQTFPDTFEFKGAKKSVTNQIGNAVPPKFAAELAVAVYYQLQGATSEEDETSDPDFDVYLKSKKLSQDEMAEQVTQ